MSGEMVLKQSEMAALNGSQFTASVTGNKKQRKVKKFSLGATGFLALIVAVAAIMFSTGNTVPATLSQQLMAETDVQYADLMESKKIILQQALRDGQIPADTAEILKKKGYVVGYIDGNGEFVEKNKAEQELVIKNGDEIITASDFIAKVNTDVGLYAAIKDATYDRAAAYYDEAAMEVFEQVGTKRNNFSKEQSFEETMRKVMGSGSSINVNNAQVTTETKKDENGETVTTYNVTGLGDNAKPIEDMAQFIEEVRQKNPAGSAEESAVNTGDILKVADQLSQEQRSSLFYALMMENISKMKAGDGNESQINDTMNYLTRDVETEVVDTKTGEVVKVRGSALESPSLYALLTGNKVDHEKVGNYSADRVLTTIRNQAAANSGYSAVDGTVTSAGEKVRGSIGRLLPSGTSLADAEAVQSVEPTLRWSLVDNDFDSLQGVAAGEYLASGAVNLGRMLARQSGATPGDDEAVKAYARLNETVLAMDARLDRATRSPLDITSKNTFLGSIVHQLAMIQLENPEIHNLGSVLRNFGSMMNSAVRGLLPTSAAEATESYMTDFGQCETAGSVGAAATASCWEVAVFDPSTLNDPFNDAGFTNFVEQNTELDENGTRTVIPGSKLANFIAFLVERKTPIGVMDGGILEALNGGEDKIPFISDILAMLASFLGADEEDKRIASGAEYVNTMDNAAWQEMKYAQRYVALARATAMLKEHSSDKTAYQNMKYFEGSENPVVAFIDQYLPR